MKNKTTPLVSIVIATYNRAQVLESTIRNIWLQDYTPVELVVVNDGSSDATLEILQKLQSQNSFVVVHNDRNLGLQRSLNIGMLKARGKYIARIDDHDKWIDPAKLSKQVSVMEKNPEVGVVGTGYQAGRKSMQNPLSDKAIRKQILMRSPFCHVSVLMRKSVVNKVGGYDETLPYSEDWDLWLKMGKHSDFVNLPDVTTLIAEDHLSLSQDYYLKQIPINRQIVQRYYSDYPSRIKAWLYHQYIRCFFAIFPVNGRLHNLMKRIFLKHFALMAQKHDYYE